MQYEKFELNDYYPFLKEYGGNAVVEVYIQECPAEMYKSYKKPGILLCPGSGYWKCSRRETEPVAIRLMAMDFNVFVLTYSCEPVRYPTQLLEVAALYELINKNSDNWNVDTGKVGIMGFSAGGHLAAHYSTSYDCDEIKSHFNNTYRPYATILGYPVISCEYPNGKTFEKLLGHVPVETEAQKVSCELLVNENTPQTFIWHTAEDGCVNVENSFRYAMALGKFGIPYAMHIYPYGIHGLSTADRLTNNNLEDKVAYCEDWMDQLKKWVKIAFEL